MSPPIFVEYESFDELKKAVGYHLLHFSDSRHYSEYKPNGKFMVRANRSTKDPMFWRAWVVMKDGYVKHVELVKGSKTHA